MGSIRRWARVRALGGVALCVTLLTGVGVHLTPAGATPAFSGPGYWLVDGYGNPYDFNAPDLGSPGGFGDDTCINQGGPQAPLYACVGVSAIASGGGYWMASGPSDVYSTPSPSYLGLAAAFGTATCPGGFEGPAENLNAPVVGVAAAGEGTWLVGADGGVYAFCDAPFYGSMGGVPLNAPVVGMAALPDGDGYWLVAADGGVFAFGQAGFYGSMGGVALDAPVVAMASTPDGKGYWLVAADGGVFAFGDAVFHGSMAGQPLAAKVVGVAADPDSTGYWLAAADGGVFAFDAPFLGSAVGQVMVDSSPIVGITSRGAPA